MESGTLGPNDVGYAPAGSTSEDCYQSIPGDCTGTAVIDNDVTAAESVCQAGTVDVIGQ